MSTQVQFRRFVASLIQTFTGASGEIVIDTTNNRVVVQDGSTPGGFPAANLNDVAAAVAPLAPTNAVNSAIASAVAPLAATSAVNSAIAAAVAPLATTAAVAAKFASVSGRNLIINGNFAINQRSYASGATLGSLVFGHDRWKAWFRSSSYSFTQTTPDTLITITSGLIGQIIDPTNVAGGSYTLSWTGSATASVQYTPIGGNVTSALLNFSSGGSFVIPAGSTIYVFFGPGTLGNVQLETGSAPTSFERRLQAMEMLLCQRYFEMGNYTISGNAYAANCLIALEIPYKVTKRVGPTVVFTNNSYYNASNATADIGYIDYFRLYITSTGAATNSGAAGTWSASAEL